MARYKVTIASPWEAEEAFNYMADLQNFKEWDPSVEYSKLLSGSAPGPDAIYEVKVMRAILKYEALEYDAPKRVVVEANTPLLRSYDIIEVTPTETGCEVLYDATFEMNGLLGKVANPVVKLFFDGIGDKAAAGMVKALSGEKIR